MLVDGSADVNSVTSVLTDTSATASWMVAVSVSLELIL